MSLEDIIDRTLENKRVWDLAGDEQMQLLLALKYLKSISDSLAEIAQAQKRG
ncbi:unnamed protein product [marine sediment metagenome]|uniref:Uncharacterized protein n=1 Tax=marine sediment metagenome TaxID=412755 RepID=X0S315_9ZZZZ